MGQSQSSHASSDTPVSSVAHMKTSPDSVGGRKSETATITLYSTEPSLPNDSHKETAEEPIKNSLVANAISVVAENEEKEEEEYDVSSDEESDDEEWNERLRILDDVRQLKMLAEFFLHPEKPVKQNPCVTARCFFDRPSAPGRRTWMETVEQERIMEDLIALKKLAVDYLHPELPVVTNDPCACGRNYFTRPSAPDQETEEDAEERRLVLAEAQELKKLAVDYLHPERPVMTTDPNACGRNYFTRPSAKEYESAEDAAERTRILAEVQELKRLAVDYLHPERPVRVVDGTLFGRSYFTRPSAPEQESFVEAEQRARILEDARQLKKLAMDYLHPELGVRASDPRLFGRNFFKRASAPEQDSFVAAEERARILEDAKMLKKLAVDYLHPELPVVTNDPCACGRNYFTRPSAPDQETEEDAEERRLVLAEAQELKKLAVDYLHPERPVMTTDPNACGRNYFTRPSADEYESAEDAAERTRILAEVQELKRLAVDYLHPERPVRVVDGTLFGRSYFARPSAPEQESFMEAEQRARILEDARQLKNLAMDYLHPELGVRASDPRLFGRNFFKRASAPEQDSFVAAEERARILEDLIALKKLAVDYLHPELPVVTNDPCACGRNYFTRPSAPDQETEEDAEERRLVLAEAQELKKLAVDYLHPERPVMTTDPNACGRNYFTRPSADEYESAEDAAERTRILAEVQELKRLAVDYLHPERPVRVVDGTLFGRSYFARPSAPEQESFMEAEQRARILEDARQLKKLAMDYLHPELGVRASDPRLFGRNYFKGPHNMIHTFPSHVDEEDHTDHHDHFGMDEDMDIFADMRSNFIAAEGNADVVVGKTEEGNNLSRSPSSVMLFSGESMYD